MTGQAALASYAETAALTQAATSAALDVWASLDPAALSRSWASQRVGDRLFLTVARAQEMAALSADVYTRLILEEAGTAIAAEAAVVPESLAGIASDGRDLDGLLLQSLIRASVAQAAGASPLQALGVGSRVLTRIVATQIQDTARTATGLSVATRQRVGYVRLVNPGACSRCVILAGRFYRWSAGFLRHPACGCRNIPAAEDTPDLTVGTDPMTAFRSLTEAEQNRQFTRAGAQAIRDGADISRVVNARRGSLGLSVAGSSTRAGREMPEAIYARAATRDEALSLLARAGYIR